MRHSKRNRRGAIYTAEMVLVMPVLVVVFLAVVQFGIFFTSLQLVSFASRTGAEAASETVIPAAGLVPGNVLNAVEEHLESVGITSCRVAVQHLGGQTESGICNCVPSGFTTPLGSYVRVSVCVPLSEMMPNLLAPFGYGISDPDLVVTCATVMQQEL